MVLSLLCPPRQLVYAQTLEVGTAPGLSDLVSEGMPAACQGGDNSQPQLHLPDKTTLWAFLTQGELTVAPSMLTTTSLGCTVTSHSLEVDGVTLLSGGVLRHALGHQPLHVQCSCTPSAPQHIANISLTVRLLDFTSPVVTFLQSCSISNPSASGTSSSTR
jgi:hypothetical protein